MNYNNILTEYLKLYPNEKEKQSILTEYLNKYTTEEITDWNNFDGHIVASGFLYSKVDKKFLVLLHRDLNMFLYPGGHVDKNDPNTLETSKREVEEETGIKDFELISASTNQLVPFDISTHRVPYNKRLDLPEHYHFDFRYLFVIDKKYDIKIDTSEHSEYKWISIEELKEDKNYGNVVDKISKLLSALN